jgi:uncharacterized membrane protein YsdA (DUF1294 family)
MSKPRPRTSLYSIVWRITAVLLLIVLVLGSVSLGRVPRWLGLYCVGAGAVSAALYWWDKQQAIVGGWRIPENTLHLIDMLGGVIGGLMAQVAWRHKTAKPAFGFVTVAVILVDVCLLSAFDFMNVPGLFG